MARLVINLNHFPVTILFSLLLLCKLVPSNGMIGSCITSYNQTVNNQTGLIDDPYRANLLALFADLTTSSLTFYNTTAGESPNKAYGLYLCRGDTSSDTCRTCVASLTAWISSTSSGPSVCKEGVAFMDECMIHYANYSFFGRANDEVLGAQVGKPITTASQEYNQTLDRVLQDVVTDAYNSTTSYATSVAAFSDQEMVYGLAQCTPDINRGDCNGCLKAAQSYLRANLTGVKSAWALLPSCQLRYDNVSFFGVSSANSSPAPASVSAFLLATVGLFFVGLIH